MTETQQQLVDLVEGWKQQKALALTSPEGGLMLRSDTGKVYGLESGALITLDAGAYDWTGRPSWEDYQSVKTQYDTLASRLRELHTYHCETLVPSRNKVVPFHLLEGAR